MRNQDQWTPKYPESALNHEGRVGDAIQDPESQTGGGSVPWTRAPATSHLWGFRFHDARKISFLRKFRGNVSVLTVRFLPPPNKPEVGISEYEYEFADHARGESIFGLMATDAHPGEVLDRYVIKAGVPYRPTHKNLAA